MNELIKNLGVIVLIIGAAVLAVPFFTCISGTDYTYGCDGYHRLSIGGRENLRLLSGYDLVSIDLLSGALSGDGKRA